MTLRSTKGAPARGAGVLISEYNDWFNITKVYDRIAATMAMDFCNVNISNKYVVSGHGPLLGNPFACLIALLCNIINVKMTVPRTYFILIQLGHIKCNWKMAELSNRIN